MATEVTLTFKLDEDVTPHLFGHKVAKALTAQYALRPGEQIVLSNGQENPGCVWTVNING